MKRIYHPYWDWECYHAGMFNTSCQYSKDSAEKKYCDFLSDLDMFEKAIKMVILEWPISCEQFLSNSSTNRIAWLGQASMCISSGIPRIYRGGFRLLTVVKQKEANSLAKKYLEFWINDFENK